MQAQDAVARALGYPYARPAHRYLFSNGEWQPWQPERIAALSALTPVLAVGSNAAPDQLRRKYGQDHHDDIPVTMGWLDDHDVVYGAYLTGYGSLPATLVDSPGTRVAMAITWLTERALAQMHTTEAVGAHTDYGVLTGLSLSPSLGLHAESAPAQVFTWRCRLGEFVGADGNPVALQALAAERRRWPALSQEAVQRLLHQMLTGEAAPASQAALSDWVLRNVQTPAHRQAHSVWMQRRCLDSGLRHFESLAG